MPQCANAFGESAHFKVMAANTRASIAHHQGGSSAPNIQGVADYEGPAVYAL
jgi:hypothetical protein